MNNQQFTSLILLRKKNFPWACRSIDNAWQAMCMELTKCAEWAVFHSTHLLSHITEWVAYCMDFSEVILNMKRFKM